MAGFAEELFEASLCIESDEWTKDTLSGLPTCKGVLLFSNSSGHPIQLLQAANLRRTAQAKLVRDESSPPKRKADISQLTTKISYVCCRNNFETQLATVRSAHAIFRETAGDWVQLPKVRLAAIETDAYLPFFYVSDNAYMDEKRTLFGLFPTRKAAAEFCETLNAVFGLCQNSSLLNTGKEASCPYLQMGICRGPCVDKNIREDYQEAVRRACETASGQLQPTLDRLHEQMTEASQSTRFEQAALLKKKLDRLEKLTAHHFDRVHELADLCILHIDRDVKRKIGGKNKKRQLYKAFKITAENVYELGVFVPQTPGQIASFLEHRWDKGEKLVYTCKRKEHLGVLSLFLFRSNQSGLWLDCGDGIPQTIKGFPSD